MDNKKTDHELIVEFMEGNSFAMELLVRRYKNRVFSYINLYIRNRALAEDIFQDTFLKAINSIQAGRYQENGKFLPWVSRIAHNLIIDHFRREKQLRLISNDDYESDILNLKKLSEPNVVDLLIQKQVVKDVRNLVDRLPDDQKEVVILRHYVGMSFKEIAESTNVSINTALGRMRYALINIRKMMEENNISLTIS